MSVCSERSSGWVINESHLGDGASGVLEFTLPRSVLPDWSNGKGPRLPTLDLSHSCMAAAVPGDSAGLGHICAGSYWGDLCRLLSLFLFPLGMESQVSQQSADVMSTTTNKRAALQWGIKGLQTPLQSRCLAQLQGWVTSAFVLLIAFWLASPLGQIGKRALMFLDHSKYNWAKQGQQWLFQKWWASQSFTGKVKAKKVHFSVNIRSIWYTT